MIYIVPMPVAQTSARSDVYTADTEKSIRDAEGAMVGFPGLVRYSN
jgi:hypothetical protein